jgi:hypothetical protein
MKDLIEYISQIFGLEMKSTIAIMEMENDIGEIQDHASYVRYLKNGFNLDDIKFLTAYQKFLTLTKRYKQHEAEKLNAHRIEAMGSLAERLADKVRSIDTIVLNGIGINFEWEGFKTNGEQYFTVKECAALNSIGSPLTCVRLQRQVSGRDLLCEHLNDVFVTRVTMPQLQAQKPMALIADISAQKRG